MSEETPAQLRALVDRHSAAIAGVELGWQDADRHAYEIIGKGVEQHSGSFEHRTAESRNAVRASIRDAYDTVVIRLLPLLQERLASELLDWWDCVLERSDNPRQFWLKKWSRRRTSLELKLDAYVRRVQRLQGQKQADKDAASAELREHAHKRFAELIREQGKAASAAAKRRWARRAKDPAWRAVLADPAWAQLTARYESVHKKYRELRKQWRTKLREDLSPEERLKESHLFDAEEREMLDLRTEIVRLVKKHNAADKIESPQDLLDHVEQFAPEFAPDSSAWLFEASWAWSKALDLQKADRSLPSLPTPAPRFADRLLQIRQWCLEATSRIPASAKMDGWTKQELCKEADISGPTFSRIRRVCKLRRVAKSGRHSFRYSMQNVRELIRGAREHAHRRHLWEQAADRWEQLLQGISASNAAS